MTPSLILPPSAAYVGVKCPYCTKHRHPAEIMSIAQGTYQICHDCFRQHEEALLALSGLKHNSDGQLVSTAPPPQECSECHLSAVAIARRDGTGDLTRMLLHYEGGAYRFMCKQCSDVYVPKRRELYRDTQFGWERKLK